jgi:ubiquinone/menaquinone biosynthesis C-methylase UbiE
MREMEESTFLKPSKVVMLAGITEGMRVADFGASAGFFARAAAHAVAPGGVVWAVDLNGDLLTRLKNVALAEDLHNVEILRGDPSTSVGSGLPADSFDFVLVINVLFGLERTGKDRLAREAWRVLKPGGRALIVDWRGTFGGLGPHLDHVITIGTARDLFDIAGFTYIEDVPAGEYHWGFLTRKKITKS